MRKHTLYVIGNGFDRRHFLYSSYQSYHKYLKENNPDVEGFLYLYFCLKEESKKEPYLWSDFENDLDTFDSILYYDNHYGLTQEEWFNQEFPEWSDFEGMYNEISEENELMHEAIRDSFCEWACSLSLDNINKINLNLDRNSLFLSFNYTLLLEYLYGIPPSDIFHIHGDINNYGLDIVFGHGQEWGEVVIPELDENGDSNSPPWSDAESASKSLFFLFKKPVQEIIEKNTSFFSSLNEICKVVVLGHSLKGVDLPYFCKMNDFLPQDCLWNIVYYEDKDRENAILAMKTIGVDEQKYKLLHWNEYEAAQ